MAKGKFDCQVSAAIGDSGGFPGAGGSGGLAVERDKGPNTVVRGMKFARLSDKRDDRAGARSMAERSTQMNSPAGACSGGTTDMIPNIR